MATFQINTFVYVLPLATKLRHDPMLLSMALLALTAVFRSYPSLGDVALYMSLLPMWKHLYSCKFTFFSAIFLNMVSLQSTLYYQRQRYSAGPISRKKTYYSWSSWTRVATLMCDSSMLEILCFPTRSKEQHYGFVSGSTMYSVASPSTHSIGSTHATL